MNGGFYYNGAGRRLQGGRHAGRRHLRQPGAERDRHTPAEALRYARSPAFVDKVIIEGKMRDAIFRLKGMQVEGRC